MRIEGPPQNTAQSETHTFAFKILHAATTSCASLSIDSAAPRCEIHQSDIGSCCAHPLATCAFAHIRQIRVALCFFPRRDRSASSIAICPRSDPRPPTSDLRPPISDRRLTAVCQGLPQHPARTSPTPLCVSASASPGFWAHGSDCGLARIILSTLLLRLHLGSPFRPPLRSLRSPSPLFSSCRTSTPQT